MSAQEIVKLDPQTIERSATVVLSETTPGANPLFRNTHKAPEPGTFNDKAELKAIQDRVLEKKKQAMEDGSYFEPVNTTRSNVPTPTFLQGFEAELSVGFPNDNEGASAPNGYFISTTNSGIKIFDGNGVQRLSRGLQAFSSSINTLVNFKYDPRALYDHVNDRFIIMYLSGSRPNNSQIIVCFSQTDNPLGAWNIYALGGNLRPSGTEVWSDYPEIGISKSDLFVTTNMFDGSNDFQAVGVFQMSLADGYAGRTLNNQNYIIQNNLFTVAPASDISDQPSDNFWFVTKATRPSGQNLIFFEVDGALANGGTLQLGVTKQAQDSYDFAPPTPQANSNQLLSPGDSRIHTAYRKGNNVYTTFNTASNNRAAIYFARLELSSLGPIFSRLTSNVFVNDSLEYSFPSISWAGNSDANDNHASFIFFNYSGVNHLPGTGAIYVDEGGEASDPIICSKSDLPAPASNDGEPRRWGDYTDVSYQSSGVAWGVGYHYPSNRREATFASQILAPSSTTNIDIPAEVQAAPVKVFPNPTRGRTSFEFEVPATAEYRAEILDMQGRVVELLVQDGLIRGEAKLSFDTHHLPSGVYTVRVTGENGDLLRGKFVVNK